MELTSYQIEKARQARQRYRAAHELREGGASWTGVARQLGFGGRLQACAAFWKYAEKYGPPRGRTYQVQNASQRPGRN